VVSGSGQSGAPVICLETGRFVGLVAQTLKMNSMTTIEGCLRVAGVKNPFVLDPIAIVVLKCFSVLVGSE